MVCAFVYALFAVVAVCVAVALINRDGQAIGSRVVCVVAISNDGYAAAEKAADLQNFGLTAGNQILTT